MATLEVDDVRKDYPTRDEPLVVLRGISLELAAGQKLAILGPSGSGKSTLLNILGTLEPPSGGRVVLDGQDLSQLSEPELAVFRNRRIGFVFQDHHLLPQCTALENVLLPTVARGATTAEDAERARRLLDRVGLSRRRDHRPAELSGGERQRAALARALVNRPALLLADEPTGNLDRTTSEAVARLLLELHEQEQMILIVATHSQRLAELLGRQFELDDGRLREVGGRAAGADPASAPAGSRRDERLAHHRSFAGPPSPHERGPGLRCGGGHGRAHRGPFGG